MHLVKLHIGTILMRKKTLLYPLLINNMVSVHTICLSRNFKQRREKKTIQPSFSNFAILDSIGALTSTYEITRQQLNDPISALQDASGT